MCLSTQDEINADLCLNSVDGDFLDSILLDGDVIPSVSSTTDIHQEDYPVMDAYQTDHMYSRSHSNSASDCQPPFSPPSVASHASLYSHSTGSPPCGLQNSCSTSPTELCASPLDGTTEDLTVQCLITDLEPTTVVFQEDDIIHMVTGCDETVTDDAGLISVGMLQFWLSLSIHSIASATKLNM